MIIDCKDNVIMGKILIFVKIKINKNEEKQYTLCIIGIVAFVRI